MCWIPWSFWFLTVLVTTSFLSEITNRATLWIGPLLFASVYLSFFPSLICVASCASFSSFVPYCLLFLSVPLLCPVVSMPLCLFLLSWSFLQWMVTELKEYILCFCVCAFPKYVSSFSQLKILTKAPQSIYRQARNLSIVTVSLLLLFYILLMKVYP